MMESWILPITLLPGIGLLIMSTSNLVVALFEEIDPLEHKHQKMTPLIGLKINQLDLLNKALVGLYISAGIFTLSGIILGIYPEAQFIKWILGIGILIVFISLLLLIIYSFRSVRIRRNQFVENIDNI
jgi:hypothetical protein